MSNLPLLAWPDRKRRGGRLSEAQAAFHERALSRGWAVATADSLEAAIAVLQRWEALHPGIRAPGRAP